MKELTYIGYIAVFYHNGLDNRRYKAIFLSVGDELHNLSDNGDKVNFTSLKDLKNNQNVTIQYMGPSVSAAEASLNVQNGIRPASQGKLEKEVA